MKQAKLKFPLNLADAFAKFSFENAIRVILSWSSEGFFAEDSLTCIIQIEAEKEADFLKSEWAKYIHK